MHKSNLFVRHKGSQKQIYKLFNVSNKDSKDLAVSFFSVQPPPPTTISFFFCLLSFPGFKQAVHKVGHVLSHAYNGRPFLAKQAANTK